MFLMRGLPGSGKDYKECSFFYCSSLCSYSGKSTLVNKLKDIYSKSYVICSADNYFLDSQGIYRFNRDKIADAHRVCQQSAEDACK